MTIEPVHRDCTATPSHPFWSTHLRAQGPTGIITQWLTIANLHADDANARTSKVKKQIARKRRTHVHLSADVVWGTPRAWPMVTVPVHTIQVIVDLHLHPPSSQTELLVRWTKQMALVICTPPHRGRIVEVAMAGAVMHSRWLPAPDALFR